MFAMYLPYFMCAAILSLFIIALEEILFPESNNFVLIFTFIIDMIHVFETLYFYLHTYVIR